MSRLRKLNPLTGKRKPGESNNAVMACNDYLRMGRGRSMSKLAKSYEKTVEVAKRRNLASPSVPTLSTSQLGNWSMRFEWVARAEAWDAQMEEKRNREADRIMKSGLANTHERVFTLDQLAQGVMQALNKRGLYGKTVKGIGSGDYFERVEEEVFRSDEIKQIRGLLDDLAKETGGRETRVGVEVTGLAGLLSGATGFSDATDAEWEPVEDHPGEDEPAGPAPLGKIEGPQESALQKYGPPKALLAARAELRRKRAAEGSDASGAARDDDEG